VSMFGLQHPIDLQGMTPAKPEVGALARATRLQASEAVICTLLVRPRPRSHAPEAGMFVVSEAAATRTAFDQGGEFAAAVELRRLFPGVTANADAGECARAIAAWKPLSVRPRQWTRRDSGRNRRRSQLSLPPPI
jgi:hypothetical protein